MKKIEFILQGLENFCNHIDPIEIDFTEDSITMITGPNGIGKTSIFQSIPFTLYGVCEKGRGDDVLNNKIGKNCHTWTIFKIDDVIYRVDRYVKYTRIGNSVTITRGTDTKPYLKGHKEVLPEIEKLLMPYKLFTNTLLFAQKVKTFFTDLPDSEQKEIFRKILTLDDFVLYQKQCGEELKGIEKIIIHLNQDLAVQDGLIKSFETQKKQFEDTRDEFNKNKEKRIKELNDKIELIEKDILNHLMNQKNLPENPTIKIQKISNKISVYEHQINNLVSETQTKINSVEQQKALKLSEIEQTSLKMSNTSSESMREKIEAEKVKLKEEDDKIQSEIDILIKETQDYNITIGQYNSSISFIEKENSKLELDSGLTFCPTCKRDMNDDCIKHIQDMMLQNIKEIKNYNKKNQELTVLLKEKNDKIAWWKDIKTKNLDSYNETIKNLQLENRISINQFTERKTIAIGKVEEMMQNAVIQIKKENEEDKIKILHTVIELKQEIEKLNLIQQKIEDYEVRLKLMQKDKEVSTLSLEHTEAESFDDLLIENCVTKINASKKLMKDTIKERSTYDKRIKMIDFWKTGFSSSGIQSMLIDEAIPFMNKRIGHYMELLCGGRYKVTFDTLKATKDAKEFRDKISVNVFDTMTHSDARVKFSGGQTRLVDIGTILTLADLQANVQDVSINIILFDEIFDALDDENIRYASNLLRQASEEKWVGLISHRHIDSIEADNILEFR